MSWPDLVNGSYELIAGVFLAFSCFRLYKDKEVKGWPISTTIFFTSWGYWNLWYYPHLNQWLSFFGGIAVVIFNTLWCSMAIYYTRKNKKKELLHG